MAQSKDRKTHEVIVGANELVERTADKIFKVIIDETEQYTPEERWLLSSRIIGAIFQHHFHMALDVAGVETVKKEAEVVAARIKALPPESML